jgi:hypothetical protein
MSEFNPSPRDQITIGGRVYHVMPHPSVPAFAFGQEGRKAFVYQLSNGDGRLYALKKFKQAYRLAELVDVCDLLTRFSTWDGLEVCERQCLNTKVHKDALEQYPDLEYAVLMAWIDGSTWYDILVGKRALTRLQALKTANATSQVLSSLEEAGLAHCDIAAPNVIIDLVQDKAHLIDVEDLYAKGFKSPAGLPAGTEGYAHKLASKGLWGPAADRFAGAVLLAEMTGWFSPKIREAADDEHYFGGNEMQIDSPRYRLMYETLSEIHPDLGGLLEQAWASDTPEECPSLHAWSQVINLVFQDEYRREQVAPIISGWQAITAPAAQPETRSQPQPQPIAPAPSSERASAEARPITIPTAEPKSAPASRPATPASAAPARPLAPPPAAPSGVLITAPPVTSPVVEWRPLGITFPAADPAEAAAPEPSAATAEAPDDAPVDARLLKPILSVRVDQQKPYVAWSESDSATDYVLHESISDTFEKHQEYRVKAPRTSWEPPRLGWHRAERMYYRVRARNKKAAGPWSEVVEVELK